MREPISGPHLRLYLLGRFELHAAGRVVIDDRWRHRKARILLKLLALRPDRGMHREQVADLLWPNLGLGAATNNLHKNIHHIRAALQPYGGGDDLIVVTASTVRLSRDVWIDVDAFRQTARGCRAAEVAAGYEEALALYGDLLPEDLYEPWTEPAREELRSLRNVLLLELSELYERNGGVHVAEQRLLALLASDPIHEDGHRRLMRLYAGSGSRDRALRQYHRLRDLLEAELGLGPSSETQALYSDILRDKPWAPRTDPHPEIRFAKTSDDVQIAWCSHGDPARERAPIVFVRGWLSHLELLWEDAAFRQYFTAIAAGKQLVRFDMRGNGLSDRHVPPVDLDAMVRDIEAVMDACGAPEATLYASCFGGPAAIAYAVKHPERVSRLVLEGTYARGDRLGTPQQQQRLLEALKNSPDAGFMLLTQRTYPEMPSLEARYRRLDTRLQMVSPDMAVELYSLAFRIDVSSLLPAVDVPALVLHREDTPAIPCELGRDLAAALPHGRFVALPGSAHNCWEGDSAPAVRAVLEFLDEAEPQRTPAAS